MSNDVKRDWTIHDEDGAWEPWWMGERIVIGYMVVVVGIVLVMAFKAWW